MRIISGQARGRKLSTPGRDRSIRPTSDRAREALFSIIGDRVQDCSFLDLYSGTGAVGLEALSRGARMVVFMDFYPAALELVKKNCAACFPDSLTTATANVHLLKADLRKKANFQGVERLKDASPFDIVFLDPPYGKGMAAKSLNDLDASGILKEGALVIAEEEKGAKLTDYFPRQLMLADRRTYGDTVFWFYNVKIFP